MPVGAGVIFSVFLQLLVSRQLHDLDKVVVVMSEEHPITLDQPMELNPEPAQSVV